MSEKTDKEKIFDELHNLLQYALISTEARSNGRKNTYINPANDNDCRKLENVLRDVRDWGLWKHEIH